MKTGKSLTELAAELERRTGASKDFIFDTRQIEIAKVGETENAKWALTLPDQGHFEISDHTHAQISQRIQVPRKYYNRMMSDAPELLQTNIRHWFDNEPEQRMIRTLDQNARAFLSNRYRRIDNEAIAQAALPAMLERDDAVIMSADVTDRKLYLKALFPNIEGEVKDGDPVRAGVVISNSEIGQGALDVQYFFYRDFCTNGCVFGKRDMFGMKKYHTGSVIEGTGQEIFSDETQQLDDQLLMAQVSDVVKAATSQDVFNRVLGELRASTETKIMQNPEAGIELLAKNLRLNDEEKKAAFINLIEDRDYSKYGALNAVTKLANTSESYDRASELEVMGGQILDMNQSQWNQIVNAVNESKIAA